MTSTHSIKETLNAASSLLNTSDAKLETQLLLQYVLNVNRAWLIAHENDVLEANIHVVFDALLNRRLAGEPIAYLLGFREFYGLELMVTADTLIPRPDTETLVEVALGKIPQDISPSSFPHTTLQVLQHLANRSALVVRRRESSEIEKMDSRFRGNDKLSILDLGTGTGAIALALAKNCPQASITAVDASKSALEVAKKNAQNLSIHNVKFVLSNWFENLANEKFDVIVSNPPYIEQDDAHLTQGDLRFEPLTALASGVDGLDDIRKIVSDCLIHLKPQAWLMLEHGYNQAEQVADLMAETGLVDIETMKDLAGNQRVTIGKNPLIVSTHWD